MNDDMLREVSHIDKCFVAGLALVGSYVVVMADVISQLAGLHKPVCYNVTITQDAGSVYYMFNNIISNTPQTYILYELPFATAVTYVRPLSGVLSDMSNQ